MGFFKQLFERSPSPPASALNLKRNDPCWCGSGQKYKKCHADADQEYFRRQYTPRCTSGG